MNDIEGRIVFFLTKDKKEKLKKLAKENGKTMSSFILLKLQAAGVDV